MRRATAGSRIRIRVIFGFILISAILAGGECGKKQQTGFCLITAEATTPDALPAPNDEQQVLFMLDDEPVTIHRFAALSAADNFGRQGAPTLHVNISMVVLNQNRKGRSIVQRKELL